MNNLDEQIKRWSEAIQPGNDADNTTIPHIMAALRPMRHLEDRHSFLEQWISKRHYRFALATVLILVLFTAVYFLMETNPGKNGTADQLYIHREELKEIAMAAEEMNRLFPEGIQWISKDGGKIDIRAGNPRGIGNKNKSDRILISFYLVETENGKQLSVNRRDYIVWNEEPVEMITPGKDKKIIWSQRIGDEQLALSVDMDFRDRGLDFNVKNNYLLTFGSRELMAKIQQGGKTYEMHQVAYLL